MSAYLESLDRLLSQGEAHVEARRFAEGERCAREVLAQQPRNARAHHLLAVAGLMQERHAEALGHVENALRADGVNARLHFLKALCLAPLGRVEEAMASYRRVLQLRPEAHEARANLGYLLECAGRTGEAADCYRQVLAQRPGDWLALNRLGYCERLLGHGAEAVSLLEQAARARPDFAPTQNELALALVNAKRTAEAVAALRRAVELAPQFLDAWQNLAKVLYVDYLEREARGEDLAAARQALVAAFDRVLEIDPGSVEMRYLRDCVLGTAVPQPPAGYVEALFDRFAPRFDERLAAELEYRAPGEAHAALASWLAARTDLRAVDLGCGTGLSGMFLRPRVVYLAGVDLSSAMLERAKARAIYDEVAQGDITAYLAGVPEGAFHLALALDVFIYMGDLQGVAQACARALAPGGRFVFTVEAPGEGEGFRAAASGRYAHSPRYVEATLGGAGFALVERRDFSIRTESGRPVPAILYVFEKPAAP